MVTNVDSQLIQVNASNSEIEKRIQNFIERKREQIDLCNIQDFINVNSCGKDNLDGEMSSCARVNAVLVKRKDSKGHLKVKKVNNEWGPQTKVDKIKMNENSSTYKSGVEERLENAERHLNVTKPISKNIYDRLKMIEDRILELESMSPEYLSFWMKNPSSTTSDDNKKTEAKIRNTKYNADDILRKIHVMTGKE